jgi:hypothetical protein
MGGFGGMNAAGGFHKRPPVQFKVMYAGLMSAIYTL